MADGKGERFRRTFCIPSPDENDTDSVSSDEREPTVFSQKAFHSKRQFRELEDSEQEANEHSRQKETSGWSIGDVKRWVLETFESAEIADKFEMEEVDGIILMSPTIRTTEAMDKLGLDTLGKRGKFLGKVQQLSGRGDDPKIKRPKLSANDISKIDRVLSNKEKDSLTSADRSIYNTKKKRIVNFVRTIWPVHDPTPWFRGNAESTKKLEQAVQQLGGDESYTFPKAGLGKKAIEDIIRKTMQERRRKEKEPLSAGSENKSDSSTSSSSPELALMKKHRTYEAYFNEDLTLMSATAIILVWLSKNTVGDVRLEELKKEAKQLGLRLLRNKDKNIHIRAIASTLLREGKVVIHESIELHRVTQDDVVFPSS